jgi:hypothetical protein
MTLFLIHAVLMGAGFLLALSGMLIAMTQRRKRWWLRVHRIVGLTATATMLVGVAAAIAAVAFSPQAHHFSTPHTWIGALTVALAAGIATVALLLFRIPAKAAAFRRLHRLAGRLVNFAAPIAILLGLRAAEII